MKITIQDGCYYLHVHLELQGKIYMSELVCKTYLLFPKSNERLKRDLVEAADRLRDRGKIISEVIDG